MNLSARLNRTEYRRAGLSLAASAAAHGTLFGATLVWALWLPTYTDPTFAGQRNAIQVSAVWSVESPTEAVEISPPTPVEVTPTTARIEQHRLRLESTTERTAPPLAESMQTTDQPPQQPQERPSRDESAQAAVEVERPPLERPAASLPEVATAAEMLAVQHPVADEVQAAPASTASQRQTTEASNPPRPPATQQPEAEPAAADPATEAKRSPVARSESVTPPSEIAAQPPPKRAASAPPSSASVAVAPQELGIDPTIPPSFAGNRPPNYPALAQQRGWEGTVLLRLTIGANGSVTDVEIARSSGYDLLDAEAVAAVRTWRGTPARRGGRPVTTQELLPVWFRLR